MQSIQCGGSNFLLRYFPTLFYLILFWCLSLWAWWSIAQYLMGGWPPGLHPAGRGGNVPWTMSYAHHDLISSSAQYLFAFTCTSLSLSYLTFSGAAHGPIPIFGPFIPTIASQNSTLPFLGKRGISIFGNHTSYTYVTFSCAGVFSTAKRHTLDASTFGTLQHLIHTTSCSPHSTVWWRSYSREIFMGIWAGTLSLTFPTLI